MNENILYDNAFENMYITNEICIKKEHQKTSNIEYDIKYECVVCNYTSYRKNNYNRHLLTPKHIDNVITKKQQNNHICSICNFELP